MARFVFVFVALCFVGVYVEAQRLILCPPNAVPSRCGAMCERTCGDPRETICTAADRENCAIQCGCMGDHARDGKTGQCVLPENCSD